MIIFIGEESRGYFVRECARSLNRKLDFIEYSPVIKKHINPILEKECSYMIFDIEQYMDPAEEIASVIENIQRAKAKTETIIYAPGYAMDTRIILELKKRGFKYYVTSSVPGEAKEQLVRCMKGYYEEEIVEEQEPSGLILKEGVKIGITGACHRMGTTTYALQLVKYLQLHGYKACYIQVNASEYIENLENFFNTVHDEYYGKVLFEGVELYYKQEFISEILKQEYDYYIYDFGTFTDTDFNKSMYQEKDIRIFMMGSKANELSFATEVLRNEYYKDVYYLFNFVSQQERLDILELMEERAVRTYFTGYAPDPFVLTADSQEMFERMIPVKDIVVQPKKKSFFRGKK